MRITVLHVGSSLLAPLKKAEQEINREFKLGVSVSAHNLGAPLDDDYWSIIEDDLASCDILFIIHLMNGENASRLISSLKHSSQPSTVIAINCMPDLMRCTRMGRLNAARLFSNGENGQTNAAMKLLATAGGWIGRYAGKKKSSNENNGHDQYLKLMDRLPALLKLVPNAGALRDVKNYLNIFSYFLQPTPANIRSMILYALREYAPNLSSKEITIAEAERVPSVAIYHPDADKLFETFEEYESWYSSRPYGKLHNLNLDPRSTVGLLLMRPQVVSRTTKHYGGLIRAIEDEGLSVIPALSTLMDNRKACERFFVSQGRVSFLSAQISKPAIEEQAQTRQSATDEGTLTFPRISQLISLTGFSFVGGPAMNDSEAAARFLKELNVPYRAAVSLDMQTVNSWRASQTGLNPVQAGMQIAIPEIDGATEPFIYGGLPDHGIEPMPLEERCRRYARRIKRWHRLQTAPRDQLKVAFLLFCFPPNKGNIGTAADLDVFPSLYDTLIKLKAEGYAVEVPATADSLREQLIGGNAHQFAATANVAYRMTVDEYRRECEYVEEIEEDWGAAPGAINIFNGELLIQGIELGNIFVGVQPTFGFEGDPMRLMMVRGGAPHHGFMAFYTYLSKILKVDAVIHVGTHGALEFMPGKQAGMSEECWPDRLIGELPNIYLYSVNNPSEGSIAKRRSYAELISYLTPPMENAGLYKQLTGLKDTMLAYRHSADETVRDELYLAIEEQAKGLHFRIASDP